MWVGALIAYDFFYYWNHRIDHEVGLFWAAHVVHHQSDHFNLSTALRQSSTGALLGWIFYLPMAVAGVPPVVFVGVGLIDLLYQFWIHTELIGKLGWFDRVFASPSNHRVHHGINDRYLDKNYGGILILWDRLFGTFEPEVEKPVFGVRGGLGTFDPIWANVAYYATMADLCRRAARLARQAQGLVRAAGLGSGQSAAGRAAAAVRSRGGRQSTTRRQAAAAALALRGARRDDRRDRGLSRRRRPSCRSTNGLVVFLAIAASLWAMGALLDGRISVLEALYVFAAALTSAAYALGWPAVEAVAKPAALVAADRRLRPARGAARREAPRAGRRSPPRSPAMCSSCRRRSFCLGLVAFLIAHGFYIAAFSRGVGFLPSRLAAAVIGAFAALVFAYIWPGIEAGLKVAVAIYVAVVACDAAQATGRATVLRDRRGDRGRDRRDPVHAVAT